MYYIGQDLTDIEDDILKERRQEAIDSADMKKGDYVVVRFASKNSPIHYIGQIIQQNMQIMRPMNTDRNGMQVNFLRREKPTVESFVFPSVEDPSFIKAADNVFKLPDPILHGGAARLGSTSSLQRISTCLLTCIYIEGSWNQ